LNLFVVDSSLELVCSSCGRKFWYSGDKEYPETIDCRKCGAEVQIIEDA